jgi:hypothetical protein
MTDHLLQGEFDAIAALAGDHLVGHQRRNRHVQGPLAVHRDPVNDVPFRDDAADRTALADDHDRTDALAFQDARYVDNRRVRLDRGHIGPLDPERV